MTHSSSEALANRELVKGQSRTRSTDDRSVLARSLTLLAMSLGFAVVQLDISIVNTALSSIADSLGGGVSELQWVVNAYTIVFAATILTAGALGDRLGAKKVFIAGFALFTAASLGCALAPTATILIAARAIQGLGAAILLPNSLAVLNHAYPDEKARGRAVALWAAGASVGFTAGPLVGGSLIALIGWRSIFLVNLPIGVAGIWLAWRFANETAKASHRELDLAGQVTAVLALASLAGAIIEAGVLGCTNPWVLAGFGVFVILAAHFLFRESRARQPMLPLSLFSNGLFSLTSFVIFLVNVAFYGLIFVLSLYFQQVNRYSAFLTGLAFVPMIGAVLVANLVTARAAERFGALATIAAGAAIVCAGCLALIGIGDGTKYWVLCAQLVAMGFGLGFLFPPLASTLVGSVDKARSGIAAGVLNSTSQTGSVLGVALFGSLVSQAGTFITGARASLIISSILLMVAVVATVVAHRVGKMGWLQSQGA